MQDLYQRRCIRGTGSGNFMTENMTKPDAGNSTQEIVTRLVLNFPGFEQTDSGAQLGRLRYGAENTGKIWGFEIAQGDLDVNVDGHHTRVDYTTSAANWQTATRLVQFRWNDIVHAYEKDSFPGGFLRNAAKYFAFFFDGTLFRYAKASMRYFSFTLFPLVLAIFFAIAVWIVIGLAGAPMWLKIVAVPLITLVFCKWPGDRLYIPLTIADWGFARDMVNRTNIEIEERFDQFAEATVKEIAASDHDEIVIVGHSFGSLWAVAALARALEKDPGLLANKTVCFLALGSSILKIALAPNAGYMRDYWSKVMEQPEIFWHEVQTKDDLIAFYRSDPFHQVGINAPKAEYRISRIRFSKGMEKKRYRAMRKSFYRTHRQYILYYDKRVPFDYMIRLFGPFSVKTLATDESALNRIDHDGRLV